MLGDELDLAVGVTSILSSNPDALVARLAEERINSRDEPSITPPIGFYGCTLTDPLLGDIVDATELSETGISSSN